MEKKSLSNAASKIIGGIVLLILLSIIPAAAETEPEPTKLHPFLKKEKVKVEPNVLLLIDTSASMEEWIKSKSYTDYVSTFGDGTKKYGSYRYFGKDVDTSNNVMNDIGKNQYNYHPLLRYIPHSMLDGISTTERDTYFSKKTSNDDPPREGESDYKFPNDSKMYILKNVMYRILTDETLVSNIRLALSTFDQLGPSLTTNDVWYRWPPTSSSTRQGIYWRTGNDYAKIRENFDTTNNITHLNNILKWFDGEDDADHKELRHHGGTPLKNSIYSNNHLRKPSFKEKTLTITMLYRKFAKIIG